jgi:PAS domain-containing protein
MVIAKFRSQLSISWDHVSVRLRPAENVLDQLQRRVANWLQLVRQDFANDCRMLGVDSRRILITASETLTRLGSQVFAASRRVAMNFQNAQDTVSKPQGIRGSHGTSENELHNLMASSLDAVAVTDGNRRLIAANAKALELFGISEFNMRNFTLDAFVTSVEPSDFEWSATWSKDQEARLNRCRIRRLDGGLFVADYQFVAGVVRRRHLCRFLNVTPYKITPPSCTKRNQSATTETVVKTPSNLVPNAKRAL